MRQSAGEGTVDVERFRPTSGRFTGIVLLSGATLTVLLAVLDSDKVIKEVGVAAVLVGVLGWTASLRPRVSIVGDDLELRGMLDTVSIPLASVEELAVRQMLVVRSGDKKYTSPALGRSRRSLVKGVKETDPDTDETSRVAASSYPEFVEQRIRQRVEDAMAAQGINRGSAEQVALGAGVRHRTAWLEIGALVVSAVALVAVIIL
jgi:hypothetical protein